MLIFIVPVEESIETPYLGTILDLNGSTIQIKNMLNELINMYMNEKYTCFFHNTIIVLNNTLHLHVIIKKNNYIRNFSSTENQLVEHLQAINIKTVIKNLNINNLYYNNINFSIIRTK